MEDLYSLKLKRVEDELDKLSYESKKQLEALKTIDEDTITNIPSTLDAWDYCFCISIGYLAITITTEEELSLYLEDIHRASSGASGDYDTLQSQLGRLLFHKGDNIDMIARPFKNRKGENAYGAFHRLLWGHDILSNQNDNPFVLMIKQKGLSGILQAFQHLLADTMSRQGLPLPGSSYLDYEKDNGSLSNYLIKIAEELSEESVGNKRGSQSIYSHMFTIRAGDSFGNITIELLSRSYFKYRGIIDEVRITQFLLIAYVISFVGHSIIGAARQNGIPYINTLEIMGMMHYFTQLYVKSAKETKVLCAVSNQQLIDSEEALREVDKTEHYLTKYEKDDEYIKELEIGQKNVNRLIDYFNEGE